MRAVKFLPYVLVVGLPLALAGSAGPGLAQGPEPPEGEMQPQGEVSIASTVSSKFSYQGVLRENGQPVTGSRDMTFRLYSDDTCTTQVGSDIVKNGVPVTDGLFSVELAVTHSNFNGQGLWLEVEVGGIKIGCQEILAVPYALSLRPGAVISDTGSYVELNRRSTFDPTSQYGVYAEAEGSTFNCGVYGGSRNGTGVHGHDIEYGTGVYGSSQSGTGVYGRTNSTDGVGVVGVQPGYSTGDLGVYWEPGGFFGGRNGVVGVSEESVGYGVFGWHKAASGSGRGVYGRTESPNGWAGYFSSAGNGVYISAPAGKTGLNVASGTKNAVVRTADGSRLLYSEESTEVWFSDYGFGKLQNGVAVIPIDPIFAQTVNLEEPYHVFVQVYGNAEVYVTGRTSTQFEVHLRDGDPNVEFSYRIVATRLGYEGHRLERAPWADNDPNLYPERRAKWGAQQGLVEPAGSVSP